VNPANPPAPQQIMAVIEDAIAADRPRIRLQPTDTIRESLRLDSLSLLEILTRIEDHFGIELIDAPAVYAVVTVGDLADLIAATIRAQQTVAP